MGDGQQVAEDRWRLMTAAWFTPGVVQLVGNSLTVTAGAGRQVIVLDGEAWCHGVFFSSDAYETLALVDNPSGQTRVDRIVVRFDWGANTAVIAVHQGTPGAGGPSPDQRPGIIYELPLAYVICAAGFTSIITANIVDERLTISPAAHALTAHQATGLTNDHVLKALSANTYGFGTLPYHDIIGGHPVTGLTPGALFSALTPTSLGFKSTHYCIVNNSAPIAAAAGWSYPTYNNEIADPFGLHATNTIAIVTTEPGLYCAVVIGKVGVSAGGTERGMAILLDGGYVAYNILPVAASGVYCLMAVRTTVAAATWQSQFYHDAGSNESLLAENSTPVFAVFKIPGT